MRTTVSLQFRQTQLKSWGLHVRVSSLRSKRNWGVGDFTDLKNLALYADSKHARVISTEPIQPLYAGEDWNEGSVSYASRSFINPIYIDVENVPDFIESEEIPRHVLAPAFQATLVSLRQETKVDFAEALAQKLSVLQLCYQHFREEHLAEDTERASEFRTFQQQSGDRLRTFALFEALKEKLEPSGTKIHGWKNWPAAYLQVDSEGSAEFAQSNLERIEYFEYLQWNAELQLNALTSFCLDKLSFSALLIQQPKRIDAEGADAWSGSAESGETEGENSSADSTNIQILTDKEEIESPKATAAKILLLPLLKFLLDPSETVPTDWRAKLPIDLENIQDAQSLDKLLKELNKQRPGTQIDEQAKIKAVPKSRALLPNSTYRFQFNKEFTFNAASALVPYLAKLGVSHCYASPFLKARPGSMHGYDIIDHKEINPEIGTREELDELVSQLHRHGMGMILDIVPNHMGIGKVNKWWMDVLENGPASIFADYFDIDWAPVKPEIFGKVTLPVLGESYGAILKGGHLKLHFNPEQGSLSIRYYDHELPVNPATYPKVLANRLDVLKERIGKNNADVMEYESILIALERLPSHTESQGSNARVREKQVQMNRLSNLCKQNPEITNFIEQNLLEFEIRPDDKISFERMHNLLEAQAYRLVFWRVASDEINYRRFFDINDLAAVRTEDPRVFGEMHDLVFNLIGEGKLDGLRIDHPDGLFDPATYFTQLQIRAAERLQRPIPVDADLNLGRDSLPIYIIVEKILAPFEHLEDNWAVHGTVGYEFLNSLQNVFIACENEHALESTYEAFIGRVVDYEQQKRECKGLILDTVLASELHVLAHRLSQIAEMSWNYRDFTLNSLRKALRNIVINFPVYRTYVTPKKVDKTAKQYIDWSVRLAKRFGPSVTPEVYDFVRNVLCLEATEAPGDNLTDEAATQFQQAIQAFAMKFQQFTGPVMAKSVEDTLFYRFNRFVGLNEVGGEPDRFGITVPSFHHQNLQRQQRRSHEMLASSTHDTKRSEDVRARLAVLSEIPKLWEQKTLQWARINRSRKVSIDEEQMPDSNDEYLIYQTLVGACPTGVAGTDWVESFKNRVIEYTLKAARESKSYTSWINRNSEYENALTSFIEKILAVSQTNPFLDDFIQFHKAIYPIGLINSLAQTTLKFTSPGVPDMYQGNELFDFSLVDPDNRRTVDFDKRMHLLDQIQGFIGNGTEGSFEQLSQQEEFLADCLNEVEDGRCKMLASAVALDCRQRFEGLFTKGRYIPLEVRGANEQHVIAFAREYQQNWSITVVPRLVASLINADDSAKVNTDSLAKDLLNPEIWADTVIALPPELVDRKLVDNFSMQILNNSDNVLKLSDVFKRFPVAIITTTT